MTSLVPITAQDATPSDESAKLGRSKVRTPRNSRASSLFQTEKDPLVLALAAIESMRSHDSGEPAELTEMMEPIFLRPTDSTPGVSSVADMFLSTITFRPECVEPWAAWMDLATTTAVEEPGYAAMTFAVYLAARADDAGSTRAIMRDVKPLIQYIETMIPGASVGISATAFGLDYELNIADALQAWLHASAEGVEVAQANLSGQIDANAQASIDSRRLEGSSAYMLVGRIESETLSLKELRAGVRSTGADDEPMTIKLDVNGQTVEVDLHGMSAMSQACVGIVPDLEDHVLYELMDFKDLTLVVEAVPPLQAEGAPKLAARTLIHAYEGNELRDTFDMAWDAHPAMWYLALYSFFSERIIFTSDKMVAPPVLQRLLDAGDSTSTRH